MHVWVIWPIDQEDHRMFATEDKALAALKKLAEQMDKKKAVDSLTISPDGRKLFVSLLPARGSRAFSKQCYQVKKIELAD